MVPFAQPAPGGLRVRPGHIEVAQADRADAVQPAVLAQRGVHGQLRRPVRAGRPGRVGLGHRDPLRLPIHRGGGGEDDPAGSGDPHRVQQGERPAQVVLPVQGGLGHGLADQRLGREVQHRVHAVGQQRRGVPDAAADKGCAGRHRVLVPGGQVVQHRDLVALGHQQRANDTADVPGTAGDQQLHPASRSRSAASSGRMSPIHTPMPDSVPARYFSLPGARRTDSTWRCRPNSAAPGTSRTGAWCQAAM